MYGKSARYYDAIYSFKNYEKESERLDGIIRQHKKSSGKTLLDVACGTGNHISYLKKDYDVEGVDLNPDLLKRARAKNPEVVFHVGDMCTFKLGKQYDIVTCLFSAIGHVKSKLKMRLAVLNMARHVRSGGVLIVEPWITPERWKIGHVAANFVDQPELKLARVSISKRNRDHSINDEHHLIASPKGIEYFVERLEMGLFTSTDYLEAFEKARLDTVFDREGLIGRGLYIGVKPVI